MKTIRNFVFLALILAVNTSCERFYSIYDDLDENGQEQVQQAVTLVAPQDSIRVDLTLGEADSLDLVVYVAKVLNNKYFTKRWSAHENDLKYFAVTAGDIDGNGFKRVMQFHEQDNGGFLQWKSDNAERLWEYRINPHLDITIYVDENPMYGYVLEGRPLKGNHSFRGYWYIPSLEKIGRASCRERV